ncbi:MAG: hypothetical protein ACRCUT_11810, partial [Spirochaetota bacterium]
MALTINTQLRQTQKLTMTVSLRQSIEMLQLSTMELRDLVQQELEQNPVLELEEKPEASSDDRLENDLSRELSHDDYMESSQYREDRRLSDEASDEESSDRNRQMVESALARQESLSEHLLDQAALLDLDAETENILKKIITSLDDR